MPLGQVFSVNQSGRVALFGNLIAGRLNQNDEQPFQFE
jgi:hypothetical protein